MLNKTQTTLAAMFMAVVAIATPIPAIATNISTYNALSPKEESKIFFGFVDKMIADIKTTNPILSDKIHDYCYKSTTSDGMFDILSDFTGEVAAVRALGDEGKTDPSKVDIEDVIVDVIQKKMKVELGFENNKFVVVKGGDKTVSTTTPATTQPATTQPSAVAPAAP